MKKFLIALLIIPGMSQAAFKTGNQLLSDMNSWDSFGKTLALGYVMASADMARGVWFCPPIDGDNITAGQIYDMVKSYLTNNPAIRNRSADSLLIEIFRQWYPCRSNGRGA